jgi:hypothetical protein
MKEIVFFGAVFIAALLILCVGGIYCKKIIRGKAHPTITTWIIFEIGILMSLVTYLTSHDHSIVRSITNAADIVAVSAILIVLIAKRWGETLTFSRDERLCFKIIACVLAAWALSRNSWIGNVGFQIVMIVAYWPTIKRLWSWPKYFHGIKGPEPFVTWFLNATAGVLGVGIARTEHDCLASLYPLRAMILCSAVLFLIKRIERKNMSAK